MLIKDQFNMVKGIPNVLNLSKTIINRYTVINNVRIITSQLQIVESQINHFSKNIIFKEFLDLKSAESKVHVLNIPNYPFPISYNEPTKKIVINLKPFNFDSISRLDGKTIFGILSYGLCFKKYVTGKSKLKVEESPIIISFLTTILMRIFGKEYGLLGVYLDKISGLKFLLSCYILNSFFGIKGTTLYKKSFIISPFEFQDKINQLNSFDFSNIDDFIKSLSEFKIMSGLSKYNFTAKILRFLGINFLPAFEDASRFMASILASNIGGSNIIPSFLFTYNQTEFSKILEILKKVMK